MASEQGVGEVGATGEASAIRHDAVVFLGHGRSPLWSRVQVHLENDLGLKVATFESESRAGEHIVAILEELLGATKFAVLILTGEDIGPDGSIRARQNVIHEAGLFQGRLGFRRAVLLVQNGVEEFSNIAGLQQIRFACNEIESAFYDLDRALRREDVVSPAVSETISRRNR